MVKHQSDLTKARLNEHGAAMIVCADDFGMSADIDRAILQLSGRKRLSAVSCMVALTRCNPETLKPLLALQDRVDIGLHLCFADETLTSLEAGISQLPAFGALLRKTLLTDYSTAARRLIEAQYELFVKKTGRTPDFVDGHLHSHQLPGICKAVVEFVRNLPAAKRPYVRNTRHRLSELRKRGLPWVKAALIGSFGATMERDLAAAGIATNDGFTGIYDFRQWRNYAAYFPQFVDCLAKTNGMLVVHPGEIEDWRRSEFNMLDSFDFPAGQPNKFRREQSNTPTSLSPA